MDQTAADAYGFQSYSPAYPGGLVVAPQTTVGESGANDPVPSISLPRLPFGHQNPMFWLLIILLIVSGYVAGGFDVAIKKIGKAGVKIG